MSSTYHMDCGVIVCVPEEGQRDRLYLLLEQFAESNISDDENRLCPSWSAVAIGHKWEVMSHVVRASADCEGGMLKFRGRDIRPEGYIKRWRDAIAEADKTAKPGLNVPERFGVSATLVIPDHMIDLVERRLSGYRSIKAILDRPRSDGKLSFSGVSTKEIQIDINKYHDFDALSQVASATDLALWQSVKVRGPDNRRRRW